MGLGSGGVKVTGSGVRVGGKTAVAAFWFSLSNFISHGSGCALSRDAYQAKNNIYTMLLMNLTPARICRNDVFLFCA